MVLGQGGKNGGYGGIPHGFLSVEKRERRRTHAGASGKMPGMEGCHTCLAEGVPGGEGFSRRSGEWGPDGQACLLYTSSLRRVLLGSLEGAAITSVRIAGAQHEFSSLPGVVEDVTEIVLNLKKDVYKRQALYLAP